MLPCRRAFVVLACVAGFGRVGAEEEPIVLPPFHVTPPPAAVDSPAGTYAQPVTALRHLGMVDVQSRLFAEAQSDVSIRGGTFMASGILLGTTAIADPQTGHYLTELPIPASFLAPAEVLTGTGLALSGAPATAGAVRFDWAPVASGGNLELGLGSDGLRFGSARSGVALGKAGALEVDLAAAEGDGPRPGSDHDFKRVAARWVLDSRLGRTTVVAGHQEKFFGWPYLYAPRELHAAIGSPGVESESIATDLALVEHRWSGGDSAGATVSVHARRNRDDYELDRSRPGLFNPYRHRTESLGASARGHVAFGALRIDASGAAVAESLESTALLFAPYRSRTRASGALVASRGGELGEGLGWLVEGGVAAMDTNRTGGHAAPLLRATLRSELPPGRAAWSLFAGTSGTAQAPDFTAIGSNPNAGLFRGAPGLGLARAEEVEAGAQVARQGTRDPASREWRLGVQAFRRRDDGAVDWVFPVGSPPNAARFAREVDLTTRGVEVFADWRAATNLDLGFTAAWLAKTDLAGFGANEASFYGLNFPRWRGTVAVRWEPVRGLVVAVDHEARVQERNPLRRGDRAAVLASAAVSWRPAGAKAWEFTARVDNLHGESFEEVPGVPGTPRGVAIAASVGW